MSKEEREQQAISLSMDEDIKRLYAIIDEKDREINKLKNEVYVLKNPKCTCWRCLGLPKDPYGEEDTE